MKITYLIVFVLIPFLVYSQNDLTKVDDFGENKGNLKMYTYIPKQLNTEEPVPVVFVLHGCTQSAEIIKNETGWNKLADSLNLIIVYPEQRQINNAAKCFNFYIGFKAKKDKGEVASIKNMIDYCYKNYYIDSTRIFITGMSAGGGISNAVLNAYPDHFKAGALIAAPDNLFGLNVNKYQPKIAILQGDDDKVVTPRNAKKITLQWIKKHRIDITKNEIKKDYLNNPLLTATHYYNTNNELKIINISAAGIKHKLLIKPGNKLSEGGIMDQHTQDINFHSTYWIAQFFGLVK